MTTDMPEPRRQLARKRAVVLSSLTGDEFRSTQEIHRALVAAGHRIGLTTVYRALQNFTEQGYVDVVTFGRGERMYRRSGRPGHHHNLVCRDCGTAREVELPGVERAIRRVATAHRFIDTEHTIEIYGRCPDCAAAPPADLHLRTAGQ
ncbi:Fur family transcriptional regulator [Actinocatenispora comari]|uniref:Transcriptional repressor n=1 Tax=Actinocatenispora comari TaxID=2807577 RepID=A0A8J4A722_9ACTN|nr:Fur family transcriptional regulator [Actinocatenispora comari]GIL25365.1 transcriptional repressor [Actinocatenispora comari]